MAALGPAEGTGRSCRTRNEGLSHDVQTGRAVRGSSATYEWQRQGRLRFMGHRSANLTTPQLSRRQREPHHLFPGLHPLQVSLVAKAGGRQLRDLGAMRPRYGGVTAATPLVFTPRVPFLPVAPPRPIALAASLLQNARPNFVKARRGGPIPISSTMDPHRWDLGRHSKVLPLWAYGASDESTGQASAWRRPRSRISDQGWREISARIAMSPPYHYCQGSGTPPGVSLFMGLTSRTETSALRGFGRCVSLSDSRWLTLFERGVSSLTFLHCR